MSNRLECEPLTSSVRCARLFVVDKLQEWRCDDLVDRAALLTSELATNAVVHTGMPYSVCVERHGSTVRVEVADRVEELPIWSAPPHPEELGDPGHLSDSDPGEADGSAFPFRGEPGGVGDVQAPQPGDSGRSFSGLGIVDASATEWGSESIPGEGKVVWFELTEHRDGSGPKVRSGLRDIRDSPLSPPTSDLDRPLDDWVLALGGPRLSHALRVALLVLALALVVLLLTVLARG